MAGITQFQWVPVNNVDGVDGDVLVAFLGISLTSDIAGRGRLIVAQNLFEIKEQCVEITQ
eukprot:2897720-Ditylum_brightwellii.AAC.1